MDYSNQQNFTKLWLKLCHTLTHWQHRKYLTICVAFTIV